MDDIPEAVRENIEYKSSSQLPFALIGGLVIGAITLLTVFFFVRLQPSVESTGITATAPKPETQEQEQPQPQLPSTTEPTQAEKQPESTPETTTAENLLGHLPYKEAATEDLTAITADGRVKLHKAAAEKFRQMQAAAQADGINLIPLSGFRSIEQQDYLFFRVKEQRVQAATKRAEVSAPPGYSEHHTGYAVDIGDGKVPATNVSPEFEHTAAFSWLEKNAPRYSFELSFPRNNPQGISYEPWHWRYVGDRHSLETFYKARNSK